MSRHLTPEQISECLAGLEDASAQQHLRACLACSGEVQAMRRPLDLFRSSVRGWSERQMDLVFATPVLTLDREARISAFSRGRLRAAGASSLLIHCAAVALAVTLGSIKPVQNLVLDTAVQIVPDFRPYLPTVDKNRAAGGGGGGNRSPLDASKGKLPKPSPRQFTPPRVDPADNPKLAMTPTIVAPEDVPNITAANFGDPMGRIGVPSNGTGYGGGIGSGSDGGVGPGKGPGVGPGSNGGFGRGVYSIGGGVSAPVVLVKVEPDYSEEARKAKWQGVVVLSMVVDENGVPQGIKVTKSLGLGLDQKAIEAVMKWRFKPGMKDGRPVPVFASVEVSFHLL